MIHNLIRLLILSTAFFMANAFVYTSCADKIYGAELELTFDPKLPVAGQPITLSISSDFNQEITTKTHIYIKLLEGAYDKEPLEMYKYYQKLCTGNEALCPISVGKTIKVTTNLTIPSEINIDNLIMLTYIGTPRDSDDYVVTLGCSCYSKYPTYCNNLQHG
ncbi:5409_t:CDS:1 [Cetraspora pellucida]|uniref:5409_t:CDS:1 n=1 Tax=Cetraspora pellucida TaxID=1433469 RepID=A0A9N9FNE9_9GLOM|nr:5409_t:CDS:1 [Cetraspora pellucida]